MNSDKNSTHIDRDEVPYIKEHEIGELESLYSAILSMENVEELHKFFKDLCSQNEIMSFLHRWQILLRIDEGKSYEEIIKELTPEESELDNTASEKKTGRAKGKARSKTTVSSTTISRVKACYVNPDGGYRTALDRLKENNN